MSTQVQNPRPVRQLPEPARFWIGYAPRTWRATGELWTDLARLQLEGTKPPTELGFPALDARDLEELLYLPPVAPRLVAQRDRLLDELVEAGISVLIELMPGETPPALPVTVVYDLLGPLLEGDLDRLATLPAGGAAVWPLIAGITDRRESWEEGCALLAAAGVRCVQPVALDLAPGVRRFLAERREEEVFDALFHGQPPSERSFARVAHEHELEPFLARPEVAGSPRRALNRRMGTCLALIGELWHRVGRPPGAGQAFFRGARGVEGTSYDLAALVREKNLGLMDWLDAASAEAVTEIVKGGEPKLLAELYAEYFGPDRPYVATPEEQRP